MLGREIGNAIVDRLKKRKTKPKKKKAPDAIGSSENKPHRDWKLGKVSFFNSNEISITNKQSLTYSVMPLAAIICSSFPVVFRGSPCSCVLMTFLCICSTVIPVLDFTTSLFLSPSSSILPTSPLPSHYISFC